MRSFLVILLFPAMAFCQGFLPRWELSLSGDINTVTAIHQYISLEGRAGFYPILGEGLSVEPEAAFGRTNAKNAVNVSANVSYGYGMGYWPAVPFVLAGYGMGNGIPLDVPMPQQVGVTSNTGVGFINAGGGVKIMAFGGRGLFRVEYRYQAFTESLTGGATSHVYARRILLGVSVLL